MALPYAAFFDLDGTLATRNQPPAAVDVDAMRAFRARGNFLFLCTGRSTGYLYPAILDIGFDGIVAGAGAFVSLGDRVLFRTCISNEILLPIQRAFETADSTLIMETEAHMVQLASPLAKRRIPTYPLIATAEDWLQQYPEEITSKLTVYGGIPDTILPHIEQHLDVIHHGHYEEVVPRGCSKADGIRRILAELGLPREQSMGFGDSMNDYDMLQYVGIGVAMGNAAPEVKAIADRVTLPFTEGGIAHILKEYL